MCEEMISAKLALLEEFFGPLARQGMGPEASISELKNLDSMSSIVDFQNCILFCDRGKCILLINYFIVFNYQTIWSVDPVITLITGLFSLYC